MTWGHYVFLAEIGLERRKASRGSTNQITTGLRDGAYMLHVQGANMPTIVNGVTYRYVPTLMPIHKERW